LAQYVHSMWVATQAARAVARRETCLQKTRPRDGTGEWVKLRAAGDENKARQRFDSLRAHPYLSPRLPARASLSPPTTPSLQNFLLIAPILLFSMVAHEYAHGYAALRQGDNTALMLGRLTWNPIKHVDPFMTIVLPILTGVASHGQMMLGGAKPVPVNPRLYRHFRRGDIIVSLAGVTVNGILALVFTLLVIPLGLLGHAVPALSDPLATLQRMFVYGIAVNLVLASFNLIPIPPLDGSHVLKHLLPPSLSWRFQNVGRFGILILIAILWWGRPLLNFWMAPAFFLNDLALRLVSAFVLPVPWLS
jgi:Zn-dependent protease